MRTYTDFRLKWMDFWKRNKKKIFIIIIAVLVVILIERIIRNTPDKEETPSTTLNIRTSVLDEERVVPEKTQEKVNNIVERYFNYCNNGEYENAYNVISAECRNELYPTLESFKGYIDEIFQGKKKQFTIQSYSIIDNKYVYEMRIFDDFLANGTTDGHYYYTEKIILTEENGEMKLAIGNFIGKQDFNLAVEDDYLEVRIVGKSVDYDRETYTVKLRNKTDKIIVISDHDQNNEVMLKVGDIEKNVIDNPLANIILDPYTTNTREFVFEKYYDDGKSSTGLKFGAVRVLNSYDSAVGTTEEVLNNAVKLYSLSVDFK